MAAENSREVERRAETIGEIKSDVKNLALSVSQGQERIEKRLDEMAKAFVTRVEFNVWRLALGGLFTIGVTALLYALFSGNLRFGH